MCFTITLFNTEAYIEVTQTFSVQPLSHSQLPMADEVIFVVDFLRPPAQGSTFPSFDTDDMVKRFHNDCDQYHFSVMETQQVWNKSI